MRLIDRWRIYWAKSPGATKAHLAVLFLIMTIGLMGAFGSYWLLEIEPQIEADASSAASAQAQAHGHNLAELIYRTEPSQLREQLHSALSDILVLTDGNTGEPYIRLAAIHLDADALQFGKAQDFADVIVGELCQDCFESRVLLYSPINGEVMGIARFQSSRAFFERLRSSVRLKLLLGSLVAIAIFVTGGRAVFLLFEQVRASEAAAQAAARAKGEFLATMSHEIRTPMNGIIGMVHLLRRTPLDAQQTDYLETVASSGQALLALLDDILDISRVEAGKLQIEYAPYQPRALVEAVRRLLVPRAEEKRLRLTTRVADSVPEWLSGDDCRLRQVLLNLVGNAIKFTEVGEVRIAVEGHDGNAPWLEFSVHDTGPGIDKTRQQYMFDAFTQAESGTARRYGGSGLGLAICSRLVEVMGGEIGVNSTLGKGSEFYFRLPLLAVAAPATEKEIATPQSPAIGPLKVLVVDDVSVNRRVIHALLTQGGHEVVEAANGREAVMAVISNNFDVVLMDMHMPEMDGMAATRAIRNLTDPQQAQTPILAVTAAILPDEQAAARQSGIDGFIAKPFTPEKLEAELMLVTRLPCRAERYEA